MYSRIHIGRKEKEINHKNICNKVEQKVRNDQLLNDFQISSSRFAIIFFKKRWVHFNNEAKNNNTKLANLVYWVYSAPNTDIWHSIIKFVNIDLSIHFSLSSIDFQPGD